MKYDAELSPRSIPANHYAPYNPSIAASASSSSASVWSDASSQTSDDTSISSHSSDSENGDIYCHSKQTLPIFRPTFQTAASDAVPAELRQNPRRTSSLSLHGRAACPPSLVRQSDRKVNFVDSLVDSSTQIVEAIWPLSSVVCRSELGSKAVLPLRTFIQETLRRSRTSYSTLQVALYYLILIKPHLPKHNFTMEQPDDRHSDRALQCGRRMFLAALILASKYLQDRNYSARAWSKISGLNTQEINQNEIAFLIAVNWKLHITDDVFQRWTEIVLKYTPPPSPHSPSGLSASSAQQVFDWKQLILKLDPQLTNVEGLVASTKARAMSSDLSANSPRCILNIGQESRPCGMVYESNESAPQSRPANTPTILEPTATPVHTPGRLAPHLGMLPTPRLTPQLSGFCTPAAGAAPPLLGKSCAMGIAMAQASHMNSAQFMDRAPFSVSSSPLGYFPARRSSLATVSTASSPESMVSDTSRTSRSSSVSSASSLASATLNNKLCVPSRFRAAKLCNERMSRKPSIPSVPEDNVEVCYFTSSPEPCPGAVGKFGDLTLDTPLARRERELDEMSRDPVSAAARTLQEMHNQRCADVMPVAKVGCKRSRPRSIDNSLQDNVRDMLSTQLNSAVEWNRVPVQSRVSACDSYMQIPVRPSLPGSGKRVCCSTEAASSCDSGSTPPGITFRGPGMWDGILN